LALNKVITTHYLTGYDIYLRAKQRSTGFFLDGTDGIYRAVPATYLHFTEIEPQKYQIVENRAIWIDDIYELSAFVMAGIAENENTDINVGNSEMSIKDDTEVLNTDIKVDTELILADTGNLLINLANAQVDITNLLTLVGNLSMQNLVAIFAQVKKLSYYSNVDSIAIYQNDTTPLRFLFKDENNVEFTPNPANAYVFGIKKGINEINYILPATAMGIAGNYLTITLPPLTPNKGVWEVVEIAIGGRFTLKSSGYIEIIKSIL